MLHVTLASLEALWSREDRVDDMVVESGDGEGDISTWRLEIMLMHHIPGRWLDIICLPPLPHMPLPLSDWYASNREPFIKLHHLLCERWRNNLLE